MREIIAPLSQMLKSGEISSVELTNKYINAIENDNPKYNAYVSTTFEKALENAKFADKLIAEGKSSALTGIPMTLKDNICSDGDLTTCCSKILEGFRPYYDSTVWTKLKAQGAVMLGKTNMDEFAMGSTSETSVYGAPLNPRNTNHVTGGSSGGVAAAVCANIAAYGLGSDTGGSVRQPASFCGIVGLKRHTVQFHVTVLSPMAHRLTKSVFLLIPSRIQLQYLTLLEVLTSTTKQALISISAIFRTHSVRRILKVLRLVLRRNILKELTRKLKTLYWALLRN